jgi:DsbC/DsbD-like thiol-disulfide interchange protein
MLPALASLLLAAAPNQDPRAGAEPDGNALVKVELVAERAKLHPGEHFTLAAKLTVTPRWHIYWGENPGDTGVPTRLELEAPKEFTVGAPQFPVPERHEDPGPLLSFVHEGTVLVLFDAVAPAKLEPGAKARFELSASWLVCTTRCFEGQGAAALELECAAAGAPVPANEALFKEARAKLPRPLSELQGLSTGFAIDVQKPEECRFEISVADALEISFLPAEQRNPAFVSAAPAAGGKGSGIELFYRWKDKPKGDQNLACPGILSVKSKSGTANYWFDHKYFAGYGN